jgi:hypothetical protein
MRWMRFEDEVRWSESYREEPGSGRWKESEMLLISSCSISLSVRR